jgi:hypothetical protein
MTTEPEAAGIPAIAERRSFIDEVMIQHGPVDLLGRYFLEAHAAATRVGVRLVFGTFEELVATNAANRDSWDLLIPLFDPKYGQVSPTNSICLLGLDSAGFIVVTHAVHLFNWPDTTLACEAAALRINYADPDGMKRPGEQCIVHAPSAHLVTGRVVYSGAAWSRPDHRGRGLARIVPLLAKAVALTRWSPDFIVSYMAPSSHARRLDRYAGYATIDPSIELRNSFLGDRSVLLVSSKPADIIAFMTSFIGGAAASQVDSRIVDRGA